MSLSPVKAERERKGDEAVIEEVFRSKKAAGTSKGSGAPKTWGETPGTGPDPRGESWGRRGSEERKRAPSLRAVKVEPVVSTEGVKRGGKESD